MAKRKTYSAEQIIIKLREAGVLLGQGISLINECCKEDNNERVPPSCCV